MPREKEGYRDNLEWLQREFPGAGCLTIPQAMAVMQYRSRMTARKYIPFGPDKRIDLPVMARIMCERKAKR